jgi:tRNA dimethylallyltransferase
VKVIILSGPTATGKTDISIQLARQFGGEVVNFDSLLLYKEITIGTAKPTSLEQGEIPHHMINVASISQPMNAAAYAKMAIPIINQLHEKNKLVYLVGGSGFYLQALLQGMYDSPTTPKEISDHSDKLYQEFGISPFLEILAQHDQATLNRYHANDHYRVRRAVEHFWNTGTALSEARSKKDLENQSRKQSNVHGWEVLHLHLDVTKEEHSEIIINRTKKMLNSGLIREVQDLLGQGFTGNEKPLQSIGYKEVIDLERGLLKSEVECLERIIVSTRQLAKSQRTWFNRIQGKLSLHPILNKALVLDSVHKFIHL